MLIRSLFIVLRLWNLSDYLLFKVFLFLLFFLLLLQLEFYFVQPQQDPLFRDLHVGLIDEVTGESKGSEPHQKENS